MGYLLTVIVFIVIFSLLILVHELGHFIMAKQVGIKVEEFGFGLPPRIWGKKKGETIYSVNWIPFGGFVRMKGESGNDPKLLKSKKTFVGKPLRDRIQVVIAGVLMNFLLAIILISIGFSVGMEPLLAPGDVLDAVNDGTIELQEGVRIKEVTPGTIAFNLGIKENDTIIEINKKPVTYEAIMQVSDNAVAEYSIKRDDEILTYEVTSLEEYGGADAELGLKFYDYVDFPRVKIHGVDRSSRAFKAGLRSNDVIVSVNGEQIFNVEQYEDTIRNFNNLEYVIYRDGFRERIIVELENTKNIIISRVLPDSPAEEIGLKNGDVIVSVNGKEMNDALDLISFVQDRSDEVLVYLIEREGQRIRYEVMPEEGKIGVLLSELMNYRDEQGLSLYNIDQTVSVLDIKEVQYPIYLAVYNSFGEVVRLSKLTAVMFVDFVVSLFSEGQVPQSVAGPVGIAQLTHGFVQEGFVSLLRFVAILSLSLGVINILPLPALDGGRLLFLVTEFIIGRRVNQKWEAMIHAIGYVIILLLIFAVTYSDIVKIVNS